MFGGTAVVLNTSVKKFGLRSTDRRTVFPVHVDELNEKVTRTNTFSSHSVLS